MCPGPQRSGLPPDELCAMPETTPARSPGVTVCGNKRVNSKPARSHSRCRTWLSARSSDRAARERSTRQPCPDQRRAVPSAPRRASIIQKGDIGSSVQLASERRACVGSLASTARCIQNAAGRDGQQRRPRAGGCAWAARPERCSYNTIR